MMSSTECYQAYSSLLMIFAELFKFPEENFYKELQSGELDEQIKQLSHSAGYPIVTNFKEQTGTYENLVQTYNNCFLGVTTPFASPVESIYKVWTTDDSFQVPHKNQKGYLLGDPALHIRHIIKALGLEIPAEYEMTPDHLTILLELFSYLHGQGLLAEAEQFNKDHLDWLPDLYQALSKVEGNQPYKDIVQKLSEFLEIN